MKHILCIFTILSLCNISSLKAEVPEMEASRTVQLNEDEKIILSLPASALAFMQDSLVGFVANTGRPENFLGFYNFYTGKLEKYIDPDMIDYAYFFNATKKQLDEMDTAVTYIHPDSQTHYHQEYEHIRGFFIYENRVFILYLAVMPMRIQGVFDGESINGRELSETMIKALADKINSEVSLIIPDFKYFVLSFDKDMSQQAYWPLVFDDDLCINENRGFIYYQKIFYIACNRKDHQLLKTFSLQNDSLLLNEAYSPALVNELSLDVNTLYPFHRKLVYFSTQKDDLYLSNGRCLFDMQTAKCIYKKAGLNNGKADYILDFRITAENRLHYRYYPGFVDLDDRENFFENNPMYLRTYCLKEDKLQFEKLLPVHTVAAFPNDDLFIIFRYSAGKGARIEHFNLSKN